MKAIFIVALCIAAIAVASADRPSCKSLNDFTKKWSHSKDNQFWICIFYGLPLPLPCRKDKVFDFAAQKCVSSNPDPEVEPQPEVEPEPEPEGSICDRPCSDNSREIWPSHDADSFFLCPEGQAPAKMTCPSPLKFGAAQENCVWDYEWINEC